MVFVTIIRGGRKKDNLTGGDGMGRLQAIIRMHWLGAFGGAGGSSSAGQLLRFSYVIPAAVQLGSLFKRQ